MLERERIALTSLAGASRFSRFSAYETCPMLDKPDTPPPRNVYERFGAALLGAALAETGTLHRDFRVDIPREVIRTYQVRRSDNDPAPPAAPHADPGQNLFTQIAEPMGMYAVDHEIGGYPEFIPLFFEPHDNAPPPPGMLARMSREPCSYALQWKPLTIDDVNYIKYLSLNLWNDKYASKDENRSEDDFFMPHTWIFCAEPPEVPGAGFGFSLENKKTPGVYSTVPGFAMHLLVLPELRITRKTLLLRLLGTGATLETALAEQARLPENAPERRATKAALLAVTSGAIPIEEATQDPVLRVCSRIYRHWASR